MKPLLLFVSLTLSIWAFEVNNGKSLIITFDDPHGMVTVHDRNISILPHPLRASEGFAVLPIDYYEPAHLLNAQWNNGQETVPFDINITAAAYPTEVLSVDSSKVTPPPEALQRIADEKAEAEKIYNTITPTRYWDKPFIRPMDSITTSEYGSARTYNNSLKSYHGGVDFRAKTPLPILASNSGTVVLAKDRYYAGGTIIIDHGEGIYTCYFHMSRFDVHIGDHVQRGETIGLSGDTGRITGPHLHFGVMIQGLQSDPLHFLAQVDTLFSNPMTMIQKRPKAHQYTTLK